MANEATAVRHLQLVDRPVLLAYVGRLTNGDSYWAEDIVQETMMRAWRHLEARNKEGHWNRSWLFTVARRVTIDNIRAAQIRPVEYTDEDLKVVGGDIEEEFCRDFESSEVRKALATLPERLRTTLVEIYYMGRSTAEAAEILRIPLGTVKSRAFYALRALRDALIAQGYIEEAELTR
ncbi:sigma-70 family RNA polymerase sigma factor [Micromonospora sp. NPDC050397]|uniref:sigma-70 family RNA polymerase sigma factor n=1 Tax=Micromonospora sp. NPDC050397 TaxID=3364279 RepID=UPI00384F082C